MARRVFQIICFLIIHLWPSALISSETEGDILACLPSIMVPRNTVWKARVADTLKINCTVVSNCQHAPVLWCRLDDKHGCRPLNQSNHTTTEWKHITEGKRMSLLKFQKVSMQDTGLYRCQIDSPTSIVSHTINVSVTDYFPNITTDDNVVSQENDTRNSSVSGVKNTEWPPFYICICSGIGLLIITVAVVSVIVIRCRGHKRSIKKTIHENQSTATPVADLVPPVYKPRESPRSNLHGPAPPCIYDTPPARVMSLRDRSSAGRHAVNHGPQRQYRDCDTVEEVEEENPLIYATLNHKAVPQRPVRVAHVQIEASEYAAIKVT